MRRILLPCDGSENALRAVQYAATLAKEFPNVQVELLNVQDPVPQQIFSIMSAKQVTEFQASAADTILDAAKRILDMAGVPYEARFRVGSPASEIARHINETACDAVMMGIRGLGLVAMVIGSVTTKVIHLVDVPVVLIK